MGSSCTWICPNCGMPSFSSSFFSASGSLSLSNSFNVLGSTEEESPSTSTPLRPSPTTEKHPVIANRSAGVSRRGCGRPRSTVGNLKVISCNVNSLRGRHTQLVELIDSEDPDILMFQETKLDSTVFSHELFPDSYTVFRKDRDLRGGGVCIALKQHIHAIHRTDLDTDIEATWVQVQTTGHAPLFLCSFYRPPDKTVDYIESIRKPLEVLFSQSRGKTPLVVWAGDFNYPDLDWSSCSEFTDSSGGNFVGILDDFHLHQLVSSPTRLGATKDSVLDLVCTSYPSLVQNVTVGREFSDHCLVSFTIGASVNMHGGESRKVYRYGKADYTKIQQELSEYSRQFIHSLPHCRSVDENWLSIKNAIEQTISRHVPSKLSSSRRRRPVWMTREVRKAIHKRDRLSRKALKSGSHIDRNRYRKARNCASKLMKSEYQAKLGEIIGDINSNPRSFYRFINSKRIDPTGIPALKNQSKIVTSDADKAECLNNYFGSVFTVENDLDIPEPDSIPNRGLMPEITVTQPGVQKLLSGLNENKSPGADDISPHILKKCHGELSGPLTFLFNQSLNTGEVPDDWRIANVFALHKKGPKELPENYRPISLTSICCKLLEHIIHSSISKYLESNHILTPRQHGFRSGHSCESQLVLACDDWASAMNKGIRTDVAVFDFSKAFDSVPHKRLIAKIKSYGIHEGAVRWIESFLFNRRQRVAINGSSSSWIPVTSGVPQGSVLGPLLFLLYINDIGAGVRSDLRLFADDCILYRQIKNTSDTILLQEDIDRLYSWSKKWQISFNAKKCQVVSISRKRNVASTVYSLGKEKLQEAQSFSYLGVTISSDLRWNEHVRNVSRKATRTLNFVKRNIYGCSPETKARAYMSLVRPQLEYASSVWDPYTEVLCSELERIQRRAARFVKNDYRHTSSVTGMLEDLDWRSLSHRRQESRLILFFKSVSGKIAIPTSHLQHPLRNTRHADVLTFIPLSSRINAYKFSFFPRTIVDWNLLPLSTRSETTVESFRQRFQTTDS